MNKKVIWSAVLASVIVFTFINVSFYPNISKQSGVSRLIRVGAVISLTGPAAINGEQIKKGMDLAKKDLAAKNIMVDIEYEDDQTDPKMSVGATQKILATSKPDALVGPIWSFLLNATVPVIDKAKIVTFSPCSSSEYVSASSPYLFHGYVRNALKAGPASIWLKQMNAKKVAIVTSEDGWGDSNMRPYVQAVSDAGAAVVFSEQIPFGTGHDSVQAIILKIKASGADSVLWTSYDDDAAMYIKRMHEFKLGLPILATDSFKNVIVNGVVSITSDDRVYVFDTLKSGDFAEKFKTEYGVMPGDCADTAYDGLMILVDASLHTDKKNMPEYMRNSIDYSGFAHQYKFDQSGDVTGGEWVVRRLGQ